MVKWAVLLITVVLLNCCQADDDEGGDLDAIMEKLEIIEKNKKQKTEIEPCITTDNLQGICVSPSLCKVDDTTVNDGSDLIDIRSTDGPCSSYLETCCLASDVLRNPKPTRDVQREGCGWRNPNGVAIQTTGDVDGEAKFAEFPWMVAILKPKPFGTEGTVQLVYLGGGSLIHPSVVLTAAHVALGRGTSQRARGAPLRVRAGEWDTQSNKEPFPHQDRDVANVVVHRNYNKRNLQNDIALLFLHKPVTLAPNVGLVCLPPSGQNAQAGTRCLASGWGKDRFGLAGHYQVILKKIELPVVEHSDCQNRLRHTRLGRFYHLHKSFMCAGGVGGKDTCDGDGGSPLVCPVALQNERYVQSGIVAWGVGCGEDFTPGVYVDVAALREWIDYNVALAGYDTSVYTI